MTWMSTTIRCGRYKVTIALDEPPRSGEDIRHVTAIWSPKVPRRLGSAERAAYIAGRARFFEEVSQLAGVRVSLVPVGEVG